MAKSIFVCLVLLVGCRVSMPPDIYSFRSFEVYSASYDQVWSAVEDYVKGQEWELEMLDRDAGVIGSDWFEDDASAGDYGNRGGIWTLVKGSKKMMVNVRVMKVSERETRVRVNCLFEAKWSGGEKKQTASGTSKGIVERKILNGIAARLER